MKRKKVVIVLRAVTSVTPLLCYQQTPQLRPMDMGQKVGAQREL